MKHLSRLARKFGAPVLAVLAIGATQAHAAITWDFDVITDEMGGLSTALLTGIGVIIAAGLVIYGIYRAWGVLSKMFSRVIAK